MKSRNIGIELLRSLSMLFAVMLHVLNAGGILDGVDYSSWHYKFALIMFVVSFCGVDCFALISGYVGWNRRLKPSRVVLLWLQVFFYSVIITGIFAIFRPELVDARVWRNSLFPVLSDQYWYITQYFGLMLFIPFLNYGIQNIQKKSLECMICLAFIFGITLPCLMQLTPFGIFGGYSAIWLALMYVIGGYISRFGIPDRLKNWQMILLFFASILTTFMGCRRNFSVLLDYASPTVVLSALSLLIICAKLHIKQDGILAAVILMISPAALSVFLIHIHPLICDNYVIACAVWILKYSLPVFVIMIVLFALAIFMACVIADIPRRFIFGKIKNIRCFEALDKWLDRV